MKKSTKLIIGLTFLAATVTAASVAIAVTTITRKTPKKQLSKQIKIFEEELETNKELKELLNERQSHRQHIPNVGKQMFKQQLALVETLEKWIIDFENSLKEQN